MELHHKLRRPKGSSIHACNICGKEGHQAANCPNGTVNWVDRFNDGWGGVAWGAVDPEPLAKAPWVKPDYVALKKRSEGYAMARKQAIASGALNLDQEKMQVRGRARGV